MRDLAAQEFLVALKRGKHDLDVASAERRYVDGRKLQIRRHPHFRHGDDVALEVGVVHAAMGENLGNRVPHQFADAQLSLRAAGGGTLVLVMARHNRFSKSRVMARVSRPSTSSFRLNSSAWMPGGSFAKKC